MGTPTREDIHEVGLALGGVRSANQALQNIAHDLVDLHPIRHALRRAELLLEAENRYQLGDGPRKHIESAAERGRPYCEASIVGVFEPFAERHSRTSCPACMLAKWESG